MSLQNRVNPKGVIEFSCSRGTLMGNRGVLHNSRRELIRSFKTNAWITCLLEFKGRHRQLMAPGAYTELFFLDEVTAFAAGHRPCAECRRARYNAFRDAWAAANGWNGDNKLCASELDKTLHRERMEGGNKKTWKAKLEELPHGAMFLVGEGCHAIHGNKVLAWNFSGYSEASRDGLPEIVEVLTPPSIVKVFSCGFEPEFHVATNTWL